LLFQVENLGVVRAFLGCMRLARVNIPSEVQGEVAAGRHGARTLDSCSATPLAFAASWR
jgi:hypothetical protein